MKILEEVKNTPEKPQITKDGGLRSMDDEVSSDDHDDKEDF